MLPKNQLLQQQQFIKLRQQSNNHNDNNNNSSSNRYNMKYSIIVILSLLILSISLVVQSSKIQYGYKQLNTSLPIKFNIIGPFPIGEREECYDTLEAYGGIWNIPIGDDTLYPSELGNDGKVGWTQYTASTPGSVSIDWSSSISWQFLQSVWGWNIWLWYGYAVGELEVAQKGSYILQCTGTRAIFIRYPDSDLILEFNGDYYSYGTGAQSLILPAGVYQFVVRMDSSVRLNQSPLGSFSCSFTQATSLLEPIGADTLLPDIVNGQLSSPYASITVLNTSPGILRALSANVRISGVSSTTSLAVNYNLNIAPNQKLAIPLNISFGDLVSLSQCPLPADIDIMVNGQIVVTVSSTFNCTQYPNPYTFTFLDYDNTVQYAVTNPPIDCQGQPCGVMLATHGAGVEANSQFWMDAIPRQQNLYILYPTGRRSWGYDWESASRINVFNALQYLATNLPGIPSNIKSEYPIDATKVLFVGHSMGGHGCWSLLSHFGDLAMGGACAAGFVKLQFYVFMNTKPGYSYVDPILQGLLMASIAENDNDMYTTNLAGLPLMARYGQNDTNVNPWHSRRMARMTAEANGNASSVIISEVPNEGHWFDGILGDSYMQQFYQSIISGGLSHPPIPKTFTVTTNNPASSGQRANIEILQLTTPFRVGRIQITQVPQPNGDLYWVISTQNVRRFGIAPTPVRQVMPTHVKIDGQLFSVAYLPNYHFTAPDKYGIYWNVSDDTTWQQLERSASTYGPMRQIFEKPFSIVTGSNVSVETTEVFEWAASYISNFWQTYGRGSPQIVSDAEFVPTADCATSNYILLGSPYENAVTNKYQPLIPVTYSEFGFSIGPTNYEDPTMGVATLAPNQCGTGLILVVSGNSVEGFLKAVKAIPQRSGVVVPDYMVVGNEWGFKGAGGIVATGFWSNNWQFNTDSAYQALNYNSAWL
ncbi:hypothetical protein PPL_12272 [Heterostelium album PN500]|uniref:Peptidase S9 prolyl oligopeptidase catalytic domain-containing protein n=1 Tax=Heterostelium pallidum (strain ATCC 26659 / Pp 5 / PN500) TaxID=670386 RepID=D3BM63_HETP5|nr:hypothetical protein PPL_12272 [Heterostelium album PN500]EFA77664.1 hypothetical protein PPL_12272 [Heterostelium album PN500]|eukprot:XP_020429792.1 hypothetical protein PPL_12272 [Heterostelium album PN500]